MATIWALFFSCIGHSTAGPVVLASGFEINEASSRQNVVGKVLDAYDPKWMEVFRPLPSYDSSNTKWKKGNELVLLDETAYVCVTALKDVERIEGEARAISSDQTRSLAIESCLFLRDSFTKLLATCKGKRQEIRSGIKSDELGISSGDKAKKRLRRTFGLL